ncbi:hypothetical protein JQ636_11275 [Bradyrhizobium japonicum]|uniref:DISARM system phospholipase D-like protein DrmC n=1 Tax=Bradyrhizobium japonicum TaxID=375 RepID=UPI001BAC627F|nr:DISARM system phospholipase D-like protein DrmC [Bradyrhizobium japonicum]MBR0804121.1 hypothetical protein [Bradyrhizobium japonicum]
MADEICIAIENLIRRAPADWLSSTCKALRNLPSTSNSEFVLKNIPNTNNADLSFLMSKVVRSCVGTMSWEALSWALSTANAVYQGSLRSHQIELLWSGPTPANEIAARRIDQALYDLIASAKREILMVTFAAYKIERLVDALRKAALSGVKIRLILEFEQSSEGQLTYDALNAFPAQLRSTCEIYHWPAEKRQRNLAGRPGKLHAKLAIVDDVGLVSSANLTDDAFARNFELGIMVNESDFVSSTKRYFDSLIAEGTLQLL